MNRSVRHAAVASSIGLGLLLSAASRADFLMLGEDSEPASISGYSGSLHRVNIGEFDHTYKRQGYDDTTVSATATTYAGMRGITWSEDKDKPCEIWAHGRALNPGYRYEDGSTASAPSKSENVCMGKPGNTKAVAFSNGDHYVRGVSVCTTDKKDSSDNRLKGIKIFAAEVKANGTVTSLNAFEKNEHANCNNNWHQIVSCPAGSIASGLKVYEKEGAFTALGLKCRKIEISSSPNKPK